MRDAVCGASVGWDGGREIPCGGKLAGWVQHHGSRVWNPVCLRHAAQHVFHPPKFRPLREGPPDDRA